MKKLNKIWIFLILFSCNSLISQVSDIAFLNTDIKKSKSAELPGDLVYIPFELTDGKILVTARLNGKQGTFMLDTGAPSIVINSNAKSAKNSKAQGVNGHFDLSETVINDFEWAGMRLTERTALVLDMSHIETATNKNLAGLIGYDVLKNAEVLFDYSNRRIILYRDRKSSWHKERKPKAVLDFEMVDHLPVIKAKIGKNVLHLGLDCGAESNLLDTHYAKKIKRSSILKVKKEKLIGLDRIEKNTDAFWIKNTLVGKEEVAEMKYLFTDFSGLRTSAGTEVDGLLGFPFFESMIFSVNYKKRKLYIW